MTQVVQFVPKHEFESYVKEVEKIISDMQIEFRRLENKVYDLKDKVKCVE